MYVKLENSVPTEWPVTKARISFDNPNVSFPSNMENVDVSIYGFGVFEYADMPTFDPEYQNCNEVTPVLNNGVYIQTWEVTDKYTADERAAYDNQKEQDRLAKLPLENRAFRNSLLKETDWWAVSDRTMTVEQTAYRQALRDITNHANWPDLSDDDWPTKP